MSAASIPERGIFGRGRTPSPSELRPLKHPSRLWVRLKGSAGS